MNKTDKIKKKLQIILYILLILSILRSFLVRARAEGVIVPESAQQDLYGFYDTYFNSNYRSYLESCSEQCPYFVHFHFHSGYYERYFIILYSHQDIGLDFISNTGNVNGAGNAVYRDYNGVREYSTAFTRNENFVLGDSGRIVLFYCSNKSMTPYISNVNISAFRSDWRVRPSSSYALVTSQGDVAGNNFNISRSTFNDMVSFGNVYVQTDLDSFVYHETDYPLYVDDSRFHARTYLNAFDQNMLEVKWDSSVYPNTGGMNYLKSILQLTIDVNDTPVTVSFDSEDYPDLFPTENSSYIPYYFLDSVGNIVDISDLDSAYLTRIELTQYAYPSGAPSSSATSYYAQTSYNLSLTDTVQLPVWDNPVISPAGGHIIDIATGNVYDNVSFSPPDGYTSQYLSDLESVPWADVKVISQVPLSGNTTDILDDLYKDVASLILQDWNHFYDKAFTDFNDVAGYMQADNQYSDTYDIIIFLWNDNGGDGCWVTYTERYYIRLMYKQFGNFQTIMEGGFAYVSDIYNYMYDRFEPLNNNLVSFFDSTLSNDSILLRYSRSINGYCNSINNGIDRVIGSGGRSLTDIYNRLGDLSVGGGGGFILSDFMNAFESKMNYLFVPTYDGLEDTFDTAIDDLGILALPFVFSSDLITACKVPYSNTLDITFPSMSIPWHEEMEWGSVDSTLVLWEDYDVSFNPASVIPSEWLEFFQYLNALLVLVSVTLMTYRHIFSRHASESEGTL